jgi:23S rRNA (cytidine1920-2'-O)/16S rRNA (cytidine1409-2'-O)-methyltransferase
VQKIRLDLLLFERGLAESRSKAQAIIMAGQVRVDGEVVIKPAAPVLQSAELKVDTGPRYVSRGGEKLEAALSDFQIDLHGRVCADVGSSTGGFSDCLLQHGAAKVYAIDVGKGLLHWKLRSDARVVVMEETNARYLENLPEPVSLVTVDASFISLRLLLPAAIRWFLPIPPIEFKHTIESEIIALIKPQFEAGRKETARGEGVIRDTAVHRAVLTGLLNFAGGTGLRVRGLIKSPIKGPKGNIEFLAWFGTQPKKDIDLSALIQHALE